MLFVITLYCFFAITYTLLILLLLLLCFLLFHTSCSVMIVIANLLYYIFVSTSMTDRGEVLIKSVGHEHIYELNDIRMTL